MSGFDGLISAIIASSDDVMRTSVEIPKEQLAELAEICRRQGSSYAEAIRRAVRIYTRHKSRKGLPDAFGICVPYQL